MSDKPKVLFIDDDERLLQGLQRALKKHSDQWELRFAGSASEALEQMAGAEIDAVVLDLGLPALSGFQFLEMMQASETPAAHPRDHTDRQPGPEPEAEGPGDGRDRPAEQAHRARRPRRQNPQHAPPEVVSRRAQATEQDARNSEFVPARPNSITHDSPSSGDSQRRARFRDEETGDHVARVGCYCRALAERLGMAPDFVETIFLSSSLHDIGKIGIPGEILLKRGAAQPGGAGRRREALSHGGGYPPQEAQGNGPVYGVAGECARAVAGRAATGQPSKWPHPSRSLITRSGREGGYPHGLSGESIPLEARIVTLADVYDALTSQRPYKPAFSHDKSMEILRGERGRHFDPDVFRGV